MKTVSEIQIELIKRGYDTDLILSEKVVKMIEDSSAISIQPYAVMSGKPESPSKYRGYQEYKEGQQKQLKVKVPKIEVLRKTPTTRVYATKKNNQNKEVSGVVNNRIDVFREEEILEFIGRIKAAIRASRIQANKDKELGEKLIKNMNRWKNLKITKPEHTKQDYIEWAYKKRHPELA